MPLTLAISTTRRAWGWTRKVTFNRALPESWRDVPAARRLKYLTWWTTQPADAPERIARDVLRLPRWVWRSMGTADKAVFQERLAWMEPRVGCEDPPLQSFRHRRRTYWLPRPNFENGTCLDFVLADGYYQDFLESGDPGQLLRLVATLCREMKRDRKAALISGDERVPLLQKEEVEARAARLDGLDPIVMGAVLLYYAGVKAFVAETYWVLFDSAPGPSPEGKGDDAERDAAGDGPKFGWWSIFMDVGLDGIYGEYEDVLQRRMHKVCMYLVHQHDKNEKLRERYERERAKLKDKS